MSWQEFEEKCTSYLSNTYGFNGRVQYHLVGKENSNTSDIKVCTSHKKTFFIEVKMEKSQCGQFVLQPNFESKTFIFSPLNKSIPTETTKKIINHMNINFEKYLNGGILTLSDDILYSWVIDHYSKLGVKYLITSHNEKIIIFSLNKIPIYFKINARYRIKKSGSRPLSELKRNIFIKTLKERGYNFTYYMDDTNLIVCSPELTIGKRFQNKTDNFYLAKYGDKIRVRLLSNTANSNVIFSFSLKKFTQDENDLKSFINDVIN